MAQTTEQQNDVEITPAKTPVAKQFAISALGEVTAFSIAIGAVYVAELLLPRQHEALIARIAQSLGRWRKVSPETQSALAKRILDVGIMNVAGASSMAVQFGLRRAEQTEQEKKPFWYELGRLAAGRAVGTATAFGALAAMHSHAPAMIASAERGLASQLGNSTHSKRFSELLVSNAVQSLGAITGNAPAQLLYDKLVQAPQIGTSR